MAAFVRVMSAPVAVTAVVPPTVKAPVWVTAPVEFSSRLPVAVEVARLSGVLSVMLTFAPVNDTVPVKELVALVRTMSLNAKNRALPFTVRFPVCATL